MGKAIFIMGTGTDVGKSALSLAVLLWAKDKGLRTAYYKPIQCGTFPFGEPPIQSTDAEWITAMMGEEQSTYVTYSLPLPVSPHLAAECEKIVVETEKIKHDLDVLASANDLLVVESAGGAAVPINRTGYSFSQLAAELSIPCLIASAPGLGTLHHTITTAAYLESKQSPIMGFVFCHREKNIPENCSDNRTTLEALLKTNCFGELFYLPELAIGAISSGGGKDDKAFRDKAANWYAPLSPALDRWWSEV